MRVKTVDFWSTDASNPFYQSINIVFTHECRNAQLSMAKTPTDLNTIVTFRLQGTSPIIDLASDVSSSVAACSSASSVNLVTTIELWQDGEFKYVID